MPENASSWNCNKAVDQGKVSKYARCKLVCQEGYDLSKGKLPYYKLEPKFPNKNSNLND